MYLVGYLLKLLKKGWGRTEKYAQMGTVFHDAHMGNASWMVLLLHP